MSIARIHRPGAAALVLGLTLAVPGVAMAQDASPSPPPPLPTVPPETEQLSGNWPVPQGDLSATRNAVDSSISKDTVGDLNLAWTFDITAPGLFGGITSQPIVVGDTVYIQDMRSNVFALDRDTGAQKWEAPFDVGSIGPNGVAVAYDMVYAGLSDTGEVVALKASDGSVVWRQKIGSPPGEGIDMSPIVYDGTVYISTTPGTGLGSFYAGGDRGVLYALDAVTGETKWWFDTTKGGFNAVAVAGGGGLWYPPSIDKDGNIYFGVGNPAPWPMTPECPNGTCRPGKNLYTSSMVSIDPSTGAVRWYYQDRPHDLLDLDFQATPVLTTVSIDGTDTPLAIGSGKTGNVVAVRQDTGAVVWKTPVGKHQNDETDKLLPDDGTSLEVFPGSLGGVETPLAYADGTVYAAYLDYPQYQTATGQDDASSVGFDAGTGGLVALDAKDGKVRWDIKLPTLPVGAATVSNDLVFAGGIDGTFAAYDRATGDQVWSYDGDLGFNAPPAIAGDYVFVGGGYPKVAHTDPGASPAPTADPSASKAPAPVAKLFAFRIGGPKPQASGAPTTKPSATASPAPASPSPSAAPATEAPGTEAPATEAPATEAPATEAPATEAPATDAPATSAPSGTASVQLSAVDLAFKPKDFTIPANTDVTIDVSNDGAVVHDFFQPDTKADTGQIQPGQSGTAVVNLPPGTYQYWCSIPGHRDAGMSGTITVQ
jgi:outer membrane protein assembly factor BamB/plastocyanin